MLGTFTALQSHIYKHFAAFRTIHVNQQNFYSALACFAVALLEIVFKYKGSLLAKDLMGRIEENIQDLHSQVQENEAAHFGLVVKLVETLKNASYVNALKWLDYYLTNCPEMIKTVVVWMKLNLKSQDENLGLDMIFEGLKRLAGIFEVGLEFVDHEEESVLKSFQISLFFDQHNQAWYIFYTQAFMSDSRQIGPEFQINRNPSTSADKLINKIISVLQNKKLSEASLTKLKNFYTKTPDHRVQVLLSSVSSPEHQKLAFFLPEINEKCLKCSKPLRSSTPFFTFCPSHPVCPDCLEVSTSCKTCKKVFDSKTLTLQNLLCENSKKNP